MMSQTNTILTIQFLKLTDTIYEFSRMVSRYRGVEGGPERLKLAQELMAAHLGPGAADPVNVDSVARGSTQERLAQVGAHYPVH
jgi:hypothetical protein